MKQISANITGSFILNGIDLTTTVESSSIWSGSIASRVSNLEQFSSSLDATFATDAQLNAVTQSVNTLSSSFLSYTSSTDDKIAQLNRETASLNLATASLYAATSSLYAATASINSYTSSNNNSIADIRVTTASLYAATASINNYTASTNNAISDIRVATASLYAVTASLYNATASIYGATSSLFSYTASNNANITSLNAATASLNQYTASLNLNSSSFATTGSNTFVGAQYFSNASNAISFTSTGSFYSDGGVRITKDLYVSGTSYFNNVTVFGTQSVNYITSSQLNIATNIITVNTSTPTVRFGGLAVYDSGSLGTGLTGSILWDSEDNQWIYSNPSGSTYDSAVFLVGPRSFGALGNEPGITVNSLIKGDGAHHTTSSGVFEVSGSVGIGSSSPNAKLVVNGANNSSVSLIVNGADASEGLVSKFARGNSEKNFYISATNNQYVNLATEGDFKFKTGIFADQPYTSGTTAMVISGSGNVGIGSTSPVYKLDVVGGDIRIMNSSGPVLNLSDNATTNWDLGLNASTDAFYIKDGIANATRLTIDISGSVGIGTTNPSRKLDIVVSDSTTYTTSSNGNVLGIGNTYAANNSFSGIQFFAEPTSGNAGLSAINNIVTSAGNADLAFSTRGSSVLAERMRITSDGIIGIGTTTPKTYSSITSKGQVVSLSNISIDYGQSFRLNNYYNSATISDRTITTGYAASIGLNQVTPGLIFSISSATASADNNISTTERMRITSDGVVGIGTTSPALGTGGVGLNIVNSTYTQLRVQSSVTAAGIEFKPSTGSIWELQANTLGSWFVYNRTSETYKLLINSTGSLLIGGATSPVGTNFNATVQVKNGANVALGYSMISANDESAGGIGLVSSATNAIAIISDPDNLRNSSGIEFYVDGVTTPKMVINNNGNVGISTTTPTLGKLQINAGGNEVLGFFGASGMTANQSVYLQIGKNQSTGSNAGEMSFKYVGDSSDSNMVSLGFYGNGQLLNIIKNGNVGIGTTSPSYKLDVNGISSAALGFLINSGGYNSIANVPYTGMFTTEAASAEGFGALLITSRTDTARPIIFGTSGGSTSTERMRIAAGGNVGIGNTSPSYKLEVSGELGVNYTNAISTMKGGTGYSILRMYAGDGSSTDVVEFQIRNRADSANFSTIGNYSNHDVRIRTNNTDKVTIQAGGNVGIGTTSPVNKLHVVGSSSTDENITPIFITHDFSGTHGFGLAISRDASTNTAALSFGADSSTNAIIAANNSDLRIGKQQSSAFSEYIRINTSGNVGIGTTNPSSFKLQVSGSIGPNNDGTFDLGSSSLRWSTVYTSDLDMSNGIGDYTIVEGEEDLFLYNNKTNKVFKFLIEEVDPSTAPPKKVK